MSPEILLIKAFCTYENWRLYRELAPPVKEPSLGGVYKALDELLEQVGRDVSLDELETFYEAKNESGTGKQFFDELREKELGEDVVNTCLRTIKERDAATRIAVESLRVVEGEASWDDFTANLSKLVSSSSDSGQEEEFVTDDLDLLYHDIIQTQGLRWRMNVLNQSLGSLRKGNFGFIFARPETGKTTFLSSEMSYMAEQADGPVIWLNNEQEGKQVSIRIYQSSLNLTLQDLWLDRKKNHEQFMELTKGNIRIVDRAFIHRKEVELLCERLKPAIIVFDQLDKIKGFAEDREDLRLGSIYIWARELAKTYCPVIGVCQASATAEGKRYLTMDDIANSKTTKAAEADWILGIGNDYESGHSRYLNIIKNKLIGDEDSDPKMRHWHGEVLIDADRGRYVDGN